jgi:hypothetical protein
LADKELSQKKIEKNLSLPKENLTKAWSSKLCPRSHAKGFLTKKFLGYLIRFKKKSID